MIHTDPKAPSASFESMRSRCRGKSGTLVCSRRFFRAESTSCCVGDWNIRVCDQTSCRFPRDNARSGITPGQIKYGWTMDQVRNLRDLWDLPTNELCLSNLNLDWVVATIFISPEALAIIEARGLLSNDYGSCRMLSIMMPRNTHVMIFMFTIRVENHKLILNPRS